jgi:hypothetical protein
VSRVHTVEQLVARAKAYGWVPAEPFSLDWHSWWVHPDLAGDEVPVPFTLSPSETLSVLVSLSMELRARKQGRRFLRKSWAKSVAMGLVEEIFGAEGARAA